MGSKSEFYEQRVLKFRLERTLNITRYWRDQLESTRPAHGETFLQAGGGMRDGGYAEQRDEGKPEPIVLVIFNIKSARYPVFFAEKSTR